jgi:benzylsuccinate CoA-transferase BbsE subunit
MLSGLCALDLTNELGFLCGKILAHFGVDVIKVERPGGDPARNFGPFYHDIPDPQRSLYWFAYNDSKRGITLNIETREGQDIFKKLVTNADFVLESFPVGYMDKLGLGYKQLSAINPKLIMTAITSFGQTGPYKNYKATDLTAMAMGGIMLMTGEPDGLPCRLNPDHAYCLACSNAALATMIAYHYREWSGEGQYVDVSLTECVMRENYYEVPMAWEIGHYNVKRKGGYMFRGKFYTRQIIPCKDGHVVWTLFGGKVGANDNKQLANWIAEEGITDELKDIDWDQFNFDEITQEDVDQIESHIFELTSRYTKRELEDESLRRGIRLSAVNNTQDLYESEQLKFRKSLKDVEHPEIPDVIAYLGQLFQSNETKTGIRHRAPLIGEHNKQIYEGELGFDSKTMDNLKEKGII